MINLYDNYWVPSKGYKYLTNGEVASEQLYLGLGADINAWWDTNEEIPENTPENILDIILGGAE